MAQEKYGAGFEELSGKERQSVAGTVGGEIRRDQVSKGAAKCVEARPLWVGPQPVGYT